MDIAEIDKRGRLQFKIQTEVKKLSTEEMQDALDYIELRVEVKDANAREIKSELERGEG